MHFSAFRENVMVLAIAAPTRARGVSVSMGGAGGGGQGGERGGEGGEGGEGGAIGGQGREGGNGGQGGDGGDGGGKTGGSAGRMMVPSPTLWVSPLRSAAPACGAAPALYGAAPACRGAVAAVRTQQSSIYFDGDEIVIIKEIVCATKGKHFSRMCSQNHVSKCAAFILILLLVTNHEPGPATADR